VRAVLGGLVVLCLRRCGGGARGGCEAASGGWDGVGGRWVAGGCGWEVLMGGLEG